MLVVFMLVGALRLVGYEHVITNSHHWRERHGERNDPYDDGYNKIGDSQRAPAIRLGVDDRDVAVDGDGKKRQSRAEHEERGGERKQLAC